MSPTDKKRTHSDYTLPEYPFGFGFALMQSPGAIEHVQAMSEQEQRELCRRLCSVSSDEEWKRLVQELGRP